MMTANLFNSNDLEGLIAEITENFDEFYAKPVKKVAKNVSKFVFNPKAYGWAAFYATAFGGWAYYNNRHEPLEVKIPGTLTRMAFSFILGRQNLRVAQIIAKRIKNPWLAYTVGIAVPFAAWTAVVYGTMYAMGMKNVVPLIAADAATFPICVFPPMYFERNNIELHLFKDAFNYIKKKTGRMQ